MARKPRDTKAEYARRKAHHLALGHSVAQARGHAPVARKGAPRTPIKPDLKLRLVAALREFRITKNLTRSAKVAKVSPERFRRFLRENRLARKRKRRWSLLADTRPRE